MTETRLPRVLAPDGAELMRLHPSRVSVTVNLDPPSTATMLLPEGEPTVGVHQLVELYRPGASFGVYRVNAVGITYGDEQQIRMEHGITTLEDTLIVMPKDSDGQITGSMTEVLTKIFSYQPKPFWQLGTVDFPAERQIKVDADGVTAMEALTDAMRQAEGYALAYDQTIRPWVLHVKQLPSVPSSEVRMRRNMDGLTVSMDDSDLCTRVYSDKLPGGYLDADTVQQWGIVGHAITIDEEASEDAARVEAEAYLNRRKNPVPTIDVEAAELVEETKEPLDAFGVGRVCRVALPDWGLYMDERIVSVRYDDTVNTPEQVRLTLSRPRQDAATRLSSIQRTTQDTTRVVRENHRHITETQDTLKLHAQKMEAYAEELKVYGDRIEVNSQEIAVKADRIELNAYVKIDELETRTLYVVDGATISQLFIDQNLDAGEISTGPLWAGPTEVESLKIGDKPAATQEYVTSQGYWKNGSATINVGGTARGPHTITVVTGINSDGTPVKRRFTYIGSASTSA